MFAPIYIIILQTWIDCKSWECVPELAFIPLHFIVQRSHKKIDGRRYSADNKNSAKVQITEARLRFGQLDLS